MTAAARDRLRCADRLCIPVWRSVCACCLPWCPSSLRSSTKGCQDGGLRVTPPASVSHPTLTLRRWDEERVTQDYVKTKIRLINSFLVIISLFYCKFFFPLFPKFCWHSEEVDRDMEFIMGVVKTIRSLRSDYNLNKTKADCKITQKIIQLAKKWAIYSSCQ